MAGAEESLSPRAKRALALFGEGRCCAQAVLMAYADVAGVTEEQAALLAAGLGGGLGRLRLTCGAFTAAAMVCGALVDAKHGGDNEQRVAVYTRVQALHDEMVQRVGTVNCGELLGRGREVPVPEKRTPEYYASRPCARVVLAACRAIEAVAHAGKTTQEEETT